MLTTFLKEGNKLYNTNHTFADSLFVFASTEYLAHCNTNVLTIYNCSKFIFALSLSFGSTKLSSTLITGRSASASVTSTFLLRVPSTNALLALTALVKMGIFGRVDHLIL